MPIDLKAMRERCEKATKGPWEMRKAWNDNYHLERELWCMSAGTEEISVIARFPSTAHLEDLRGDINDNNSTFIAHSRTDMEQLLEAVGELKTIVQYAIDSDAFEVEYDRDAEFKERAEEILARFK